MTRTVSCIVALCWGATAWSQTTVRISTATSGTEANSHCMRTALSGDGRVVSFSSGASTLVQGDTNNEVDVFVRDLANGMTSRVSVSSTGGQAVNGESDLSALSHDGRFVVFQSNASNLVSGDTNAKTDIFVRDRTAGTTILLSAGWAGEAANGDSSQPCISADGRVVAFRSAASNLVLGDANGLVDVFVHDIQSSVTTLVSVDSAGVQGNDHCHTPALSADGHFVSFTSGASNLVPGDTNAKWDIFVRDLTMGTIVRASVSSSGVQGNGHSGNPSLSGDGRLVAFDSSAVNLVPGLSIVQDVYVRDLWTGVTTRASVLSSGAQGATNSAGGVISSNGRYVAFASTAPFVVGDTNGALDVFLHDRATGVTYRASVTSTAGQVNGSSAGAALSAEGGAIAFESGATNIVPGDSNGMQDVFLHERGDSGFASICEGGSPGVARCPCSNPPASAGSGCDNSSATGGAFLTASGVPLLSSDTLVFTTSRQTPTGTSVVMQGDVEVSGGAIFGQGLRCASGVLKRLYVRIASGGSVSLPDVAGGDSSVSARSAELGDPIQPGQDRWYLVYYRDPVVLGSCHASSTFNATQTGRVTWSP